MAPDYLLGQALGGLANASALFLVAAGLSLLFGVTRVVNFAHGTLAMLGAYLAYTLADPLGLGFWAAVLLAPFGIAGLGLVIEMTLLRRIYDAPELFQLVGTFALVLIAEDLVPLIWGPADLLGPRAPGLSGAVTLAGTRLPQYDLFLIVLGPVLLLALWLLLRRTRFGLLTRAATEDRTMVAALGTNPRWLFSAVFALGAFLAGLGGALLIPRSTIHHEMDVALIVEAFVVVVVGGMGSLPGAYLAAVLLSLVTAFGHALIPQGSLVTMGAMMALVLILRPHGLLGRAETQGGPSAIGEGQPLRPAGPGLRRLGLAAMAASLLAPLVLDGYALSVLSEALILALFAASLHLVMGLGGMVSFGHAALFALGAYGAALAATAAGLPMAAALGLGAAAGGLGGLIVGWFVTRLSGVYLAMLTLAFAEILHGLAMQWLPVTGGDNGILGIWPPDPVAGPAGFAWLTLALVLPALVGLRAVAFAGPGRTLRAARDARARAAACGLDVARVQTLAFGLAGAAAGLAGGLFAYLKGSVFPTVAAIPTSVDALVMVLLGGVHALSGPVLGALTYVGLETLLAAATDSWRLVVGAGLLVLVLAFPGGVAGAGPLLVRAAAHLHRSRTAPTAPVPPAGQDS